jgi:hypothetical protein
MRNASACDVIGSTQMGLAINRQEDIETQSVVRFLIKAKAVPLHATEALGGEGV